MEILVGRLGSRELYRVETVGWSGGPEHHFEGREIVKGSDGTYVETPERPTFPVERFDDAQEWLRAG